MRSRSSRCCSSVLSACLTAIPASWKRCGQRSNRSCLTPDTSRSDSGAVTGQRPPRPGRRHRNPPRMWSSVVGKSPPRSPRSAPRCPAAWCNAAAAAATPAATGGLTRHGCTAPPGPGPAPSNGKTVTRSLSDEQAERYRRLFDNAARLRDLAAELKTLAVQQAQADLDRSPS